MPVKGKYHSKGKFLIAGEYLVLSGAMALALPLNRGQSLETVPADGMLLEWESWYRDHCWFSCRLSTDDYRIIESSDADKAVYLSRMMHEASQISKEQRTGNGQSGRSAQGRPLMLKALKIITRLEFDPSWGMGSSSTLISNLAYLFGIDPFELHFRVSGGSGYDIACARSKGPILYRLKDGAPEVIPVEFRPEFSGSLYFVYSGRKQVSETSVAVFTRKNKAAHQATKRVSGLSRQILLAREQAHFNRLLDEHEKILSGLLSIPPLKNRKYPDFRGSVKSLGAWGGDFFLASSEEGPRYIVDYFSRHGHEVMFPYDELAGLQAGPP